MKVTDLNLKDISGDVAATDALNRRIVAWLRNIDISEVKDSMMTMPFTKVKVHALAAPTTTAAFEDYIKATNPRNPDSNHWIYVGKVPDNLRFFDRLKAGYVPKSDAEKAATLLIPGISVGFGGVTVLDLDGTPSQNQVAWLQAPLDATDVVSMNRIASTEKSYMHAVLVRKGTVRPILNRTGEVFPDAVFENLTDAVQVSGGLQPHPWMSAVDTVVAVEDIKAQREVFELEAKIAAQAANVGAATKKVTLTKLGQALIEIETAQAADATITESMLAQFGVDPVLFAQTEVGKAQAARLIGA